jgi:hypothetical protein
LAWSQFALDDSPRFVAHSRSGQIARADVPAMSVNRGLFQLFQW